MNPLRFFRKLPLYYYISTLILLVFPLLLLRFS